jgi:hypothetical protein
MKFMVYFFLFSIRLSRFQIKIIYKNNKVIKFIEVHNPDRRVIDVDPIWHRLNIKNNFHLKAF